MKKTLIIALLTLSLGFAYAQPSGTITAFAGPKNKIPAGWVVCDGALYDRTKPGFIALFNAIGVSWGGDGGNKFAVPDLRGQFLRGVSDDSNIDLEKDARNKSRPDLNSSGNGGNAVGSKQNDAIITHTHGYTHFNNGKISDMSNDQDQRKASYGDMVGATTDPPPVSSTETRPKNSYVYYIIKL